MRRKPGHDHAVSHHEPDRPAVSSQNRLVSHEGVRDREKKGARIMKSPILYLALERRNSDRPHSRVHSARSLLADIRDLAPDITSRAAEIEAARRLPPDLVDVLRSIGAFRMLVPQSHGGLELDLDRKSVV